MSGEALVQTCPESLHVGHRHGNNKDLLHAAIEHLQKSFWKNKDTKTWICLYGGWTKIKHKKKTNGGLMVIYHGRIREKSRITQMVRDSQKLIFSVKMVLKKHCKSLPSPNGDFHRGFYY